MMTEYLMTGSFGLDNDDWQGNFYDDDLPSDWRISYYSTLLRSVLLPRQEWRKAVTDEWFDEVDQDFKFVLYAELGVDEENLQLVEEIGALPESFTDKIAGIVLKMTSGTDSQRNTAVALNARFPVCIDPGQEPAGLPDIEGFCIRENISLVWYPDRMSTPMSQGGFLVTLISGLTLPEQRDVISKISHWMSDHRIAGLFNTDQHDAPVKAQETRVLAELMGV